MDAESEIYRTFRSLPAVRKLFGAGDRVAVACSGGPDSMALLDLLGRYAPERGLQLSVAHLNHQLRGEDSEKDEAFVRQAAGERGLPFYSRRADVAAEAKKSRSNLEATARRLRYDYFNALIIEKKTEKVATGHTANDQAETVLLRLVRGSGTRGFAGIYPAVEDKIIRPLLGLTREEVLLYLKDAGVHYHTDPTNFDRRFLRNKIRLDLLPQLRELNPRIVPLLNELAERAGEEEDFLEREAERWLHARKSEKVEIRGGIPSAELTKLPVALQRRVLRRLLKDCGGPDFTLSHAQLETLRRFTAEGKGGKRLELPHGIEAWKEFGRLRVAKSQDADDDFCYPVEVPGEHPIPELGVRLQFKIYDATAFRRTYNEMEQGAGVDWSKITPPLRLRSWRAGDRFQPLGNRKALKLKELFYRRKVPAARRKLWPLVTAGERIIWVRDFPAEAAAAVTPATRKVLVIEETPFQ